MSVDEFRYILNTDTWTTKEKLINEFFALNYNHLDDLKLVKDEIAAYLEEEEDYFVKKPLLRM